MATAYAANSPVEAATIGVGVDDATSRTLVVSAPLDNTVASGSEFSSPQPSPRINLPPPPNPPFVFPPRPSSASAPSSFSRATARRPQSAIELNARNFDFAGDIADRASPSRSSPALPDFSFHPGGTLSPDTATRRPQSPALPDFSFNPGTSPGSDGSLLSPPHSPASPRMIPNRNGHRRGTSEFVGGKLKAGESISVMSSSPTQSDGGFASPALTPVPASARKSKHAHRRSGAISSHDLSQILAPKSPNLSKGNSVPTTPVEDLGDSSRSLPDTSLELKVEPSPTESKEEVTSEEKVEGANSRPVSRSSPRPATRARVGFSDTLEFIPRPLSLISTDTSSTVTGRYGHSVSGSISSILSATTSMAPDRDPSGLLGSPVSSTKSSSRPSTAGAVLERTPSLHVLTESPQSPRRRNSIPLLTDLPQGGSSSPSKPSPTKTPKRWSFFGLESFASTGSPTKTRPVSSSSADAISKTVDVGTSSSEPHVDADDVDVKSHSEVKKKKKRQKKVKSWAGSILTRKSKSRSQKSKPRRRSETPPLRRLTKDDDMGEKMMEVSSQKMTRINVAAQPSSDLEFPNPRRISDDDASIPMIDLDAALGPFNTPSGRDSQWEEAQRSGAPPKRQLHSAAGLRGFSGPGMHYHRRAESAPEMPPFEAGRFGIHRFGSSSTMADVFEEDEEEEEEDDQDASSPSEGSTDGAREGSSDEAEEASETDDAATTPTQERDLGIACFQDDAQTSPSSKRKGSGSSLELQPPGSRMRTETSSTSLHEEIILEEPNWGVSWSEASYQVGSETSTSASRNAIDNTELSPVEVAPGVLSTIPMMPVSPFSMSHASSFPSPRSPMSYDAHRISTAPSSITDDGNTFQSLLMGEPGPEVVRMSVDVPSLTSSNSTMTRESTLAPGVRPRNVPFHEQRPASFTTTAFGRRRSSLASLSRLISSAHGERSKLSMEVPCDDEPEKKQKTSKSRRLSRMMQFWKPKESTGS